MITIWDEKKIKPGGRLRVDKNHPGEFFWLNDHNNRKGLFLESETKFKYKKLKKLNGVDVNIEISKDEKKLGIYLYYDLETGDGLKEFEGFCRFIIKNTFDLPNADLVFKQVINEIETWNKLFKGRSDGLLGENEIIGLYGELLFIKNFFEPIIGIKNSINSWEDGEQDFQFNKKLFEIKTSSMAKDKKINISSLEQLDTNSGDIFICRQTVGKVDFKNNENNSLNGIVKDILNIIRESEDPTMTEVFSSKLYDRGYEKNKKYEQFFNLEQRQFIEIKENFPRLTPHNVDTRIKKVNYEIDEIYYLDFLIDESSAKQLVES